ncbi:MAG: SH3 domain-containing protein [Thermoflexales bacterium]|nr:SH3 domain-containing protein [Thermoflexales bacterium]
MGISKLRRAVLAIAASTLCALSPGLAMPAMAAAPAAAPATYDPGFIRLTVGWADPAMVSQFIGDGLLTVVQYYNPDGTWTDVQGWQQKLVNTNKVEWAVWEKDWGRGPFRWVVKNAAKGYLMATSGGFYLPVTGGIVNVSITIPSTVAVPASVPGPLLPTPTQKARALDPAAQATVTDAAIEIRRAPSATSFVFAEFRRGVQAQVLGVSPDRKWVLLSAQGVTGWAVYGAGMSLTAAAQKVGVVSDYPTVQVIVRRLTVRASPSTSSVAMGVVQAGDEVEVMATSADGSWFNIRLGTLSGWIYGESTVK